MMQIRLVLTRSRITRIMIMICLLIVLLMLYFFQHTHESNKALAQAVLEQDTLKVKKLLESRADPNTRRFLEQQDGSTGFIFDTFHNTFDSRRRAQLEASQTLLMVAVNLGNFEIVEDLLKHGASPNIRIANGRTALFYLSAVNIDRIAEALLKHGSNPEIRDKKGRTALMFFAESGSISGLSALLKLDVQVNKVDNQGHSALELTVRKQHTDCAILLLQKGARIEDFRRLGITPVLWAVTHRSLQLLKCIWANETGKLSKTGRTKLIGSALEIAMQNRISALVEFLIHNSEDIRGDCFNLPLIAACREHNLPIIRELLKRGADVNSADKYGTTPVLAAANTLFEINSPPAWPSDLSLGGITAGTQEGIFRQTMALMSAVMSAKIPERTYTESRNAKERFEAVKLLLSKGANINVTDKLKTTPLMLAVGSVVLTRFLLGQHLDVNAQNSHGRTSLMFALNQPSMELLLKAGANVNLVNDDGETAILSFANNNKTIIRLIATGANIRVSGKVGQTLLMRAVIRGMDAKHLKNIIQHNVDVSARDKDGKTALQYAIIAQNVPIITLLQKAGAKN